jgi:hypothetical protein
MKLLLSVVTLSLAGFGLQLVFAQNTELSAAELQAKSARKLSKEELEQLLPGARVTRWSTNAELSWTNNADGKFLANDRGTAGGSGMGKRSGMRGGSPGTWRISEDGQYCVDIAWEFRDREKWCRDIYQANGNHYMLKKGKGNGGGTATLLKIKK